MSEHRWIVIDNKQLKYGRETARRMLQYSNSITGGIGLSKGVGHFERKFETEEGVADQLLSVSEN